MSYISALLHWVVVILTPSSYRSSFDAHVTASAIVFRFPLSSLFCSCFATRFRFGVPSRESADGLLWYVISVPLTIVYLQSRPVGCVEIISYPRLPISTVQRLQSTEEFGRPPTGRALHAEHVYLCTQTLRRRLVCFAVVGSPRHFDWLVTFRKFVSCFFIF